MQERLEWWKTLKHIRDCREEDGHPQEETDSQASSFTTMSVWGLAGEAWQAAGHQAECAIEAIPLPKAKITCRIQRCCCCCCWWIDHVHCKAPQSFLIGFGNPTISPKCLSNMGDIWKKILCVCYIAPAQRYADLKKSISINHWICVQGQRCFRP